VQSEFWFWSKYVKNGAQIMERNIQNSEDFLGIYVGKVCILRKFVNKFKDW